MSLTGQLRNPNSPVSKFFDRHMDLTAAQHFVEAQNAELVLRTPIVTPGANPTLVGNAFCYMFRWTVAPLRTDELVSYHGAKKLRMAGLHKEIVNHGYHHPETRPLLAILLALFEETYRRGEVPELLTLLQNKELDKLLLATAQDDSLRASIEDVTILAETIPGVWGDDLIVRRGFKASPRFSGSRDVGGADANWLLNGTLWDSRCTRMVEPFTLENLMQQIGYAVLDYGDALNIENLAWYYVRQQCRLIYPLNALVRDIKDLRRKFQEEVASYGHRHEYDYDSYFPISIATRFLEPPDGALYLED
jgi:hypothetical protein